MPYNVRLTGPRWKKGVEELRYAGVFHEGEVMVLAFLDNRPVLKAFLLAPLTPCVIAMVISLPSGRLGEGLWLCMILLPVSYGVTLVPGSLLYWLAHKIRWISVWSYIAMGLICALVVSVAIWWDTLAERLAHPGRAGWMPFVTFSVIAGIFGCATGVVFWRLERPGYGARNQ